jgi:hypothetical protein
LGASPALSFTFAFAPLARGGGRNGPTTRLSQGVREVLAVLTGPGLKEALVHGLVKEVVGAVLMAHIHPLIVSDVFLQSLGAPDLFVEKLLLCFVVRLLAHSTEHSVPIGDELLQFGVPKELHTDKALDVVHHTCGLVNLVMFIDDEQQLTASQEGVGGGSLVCQDLELTSQSTLAICKRPAASFASRDTKPSESASISKLTVAFATLWIQGAAKSLL